MPRPEPDRTSELTAPVIAFADEIGQFEFDFDSGLPGIQVAPERCRLPRIVAAKGDLLGADQIYRRVIAVAQRRNAVRLNCAARFESRFTGLV